MKKNNTYRSVSTKAHVKSKPKSIPKSLVSKLAMLLGVIIPIAMMIAYAMNRNFFSVTRIISVFVLIISIAAYLKDEIMYPQLKAVHNDNKLSNKKIVVQKKHNASLSFILKKGTVQFVLSMIIIILCTYLGQVIYSSIGKI